MTFRRKRSGVRVILCFCCQLRKNPLAVVLTSSTSFASSQARKLIRSDARPLPTEIASLDFGGGPFAARLPLSGGALTKLRGVCIGATRAVVLPFDPLTTPLRGAVPSPLQGEFGPQSGPQRRPAGGESASNAAKSTPLNLP